MITFSSGAAIHGSSISGGYAGAKAAVRFLTGYANAEVQREALPVRFVSVLPDLTPTTGLGSRAVAAYAERLGVDVATFLADRGPALTPEQVGKAVVDLAGRRELDRDAYLLGAAGLGELP